MCTVPKTFEYKFNHFSVFQCDNFGCNYTSPSLRRVVIIYLRVVIISLRVVIIYLTVVI